MSPLISEMVAINPAGAVDWHWFDMSAAYKSEQHISAEILSKKLPFEKVALVCAYEDKKALIFVFPIVNMTGVMGFQFEKNKVMDLKPFSFFTDDEGVKVKHKDGTPFDYRTSQAANVLAFIAAFIDSLEFDTVTAHQPIKPKNWEKKIRQNKVPTYDWTTIVIEPSKSRSEHQGGTHASPRWHERRGHWRTIKKTGKKVWIKHCEVGNKALGAVFHDYVINKDAHAIA